MRVPAWAGSYVSLLSFQKVIFFLCPVGAGRRGKENEGGEERARDGAVSSL